VLSSSTYQYDADNNRTQALSAAGSITAYSYDRLNRVTAVTPSSGQATLYGYDANGNRTVVNAPAGITNYSYDAANRMTAAGGAALSYDHNGNLTNDGAHGYTYDAYNRLAGVSGFGTSYTYDGHGLRIGQNAPSGAYLYVNNPLTGKALIENGPDGSFVNFYAGAHLISETSPALQLYYHYDSIGNVVAATDGTGKVKQNYSYDAWGKNGTIDTLGNKNKYKAMRGYTDPVTGFIYLGGGSYYNPIWGRMFSGHFVSGYPDADVFHGDNPVR
jgi:YD repeat-containing protein